MFEKFTERARKVMVLARQEAQRLNSEFIGTEHVLLGLIQEGGGLAAQILKARKVASQQVRQEVEKLITPRTSPSVTLGQLPYSPRTKRAIDLAHEVAAQFGQNVLGTEFLLAGLFRETEGIAAQVLSTLGVDEAGILEEIKRFTPPVLPLPKPGDKIRITNAVRNGWANGLAATVYDPSRNGLKQVNAVVMWRGADIVICLDDREWERLGHTCRRCGNEITDCLLEFEIPGQGIVQLCEKDARALDGWLESKSDT